MHTSYAQVFTDHHDRSLWRAAQNDAAHPNRTRSNALQEKFLRITSTECARYSGYIRWIRRLSSALGVFYRRHD